MLAVLCSLDDECSNRLCCRVGALDKAQRSTRLFEGHAHNLDLDRLGPEGVIFQIWGSGHGALPDV